MDSVLLIMVFIAIAFAIQPISKALSEKLTWVVACIVMIAVPVAAGLLSRLF